MGAIGHVIDSALTQAASSGRESLAIVRVDRTKAPLKDGEAAVDAAVICVKTHGTAWAAEVAARIVARDGVAITIQNGLGNYEILRSAVGERRAAVGVIYVGASLDANGDLHATGPGRAELGRPNAAAPGMALDKLAALLVAGGMTVSVVDDAWPAVWRKVVTNAAVNPTTALLGLVNEQLLRDPVSARLADRLAREVARVATARGTRIAEDDAVRWWRDMAKLTGANRSSMLQDVEAKRVTEVDAICGAVYREGQRLGVEAPLNQAMTLLVTALYPDGQASARS
jgi:2-dehydropantoate 2-reductase